jgi:colicin import membrane protein
MRTGLTISTIAHGAFLAWSILTLVAKPFDSPPMETMPVDIISSDQFSKITTGERLGKKNTPPQARVEKIGETKPVEEPTKKITEKKEITPTAAAEPPPSETKPEPKPEKTHEPKADPIAEALKKDEAKKPEKKVEAKPPTPTPPKKPTPPQPKFDPAKVAALLDKRDPQRNAATGSVMNANASLGSSTGHAQQLSQSELDALRARLSQCWNPPVGALDAQKLVVVLRVVFNTDGTVARVPELVEATASPIGPALAESAKRAVLQCQPFTMLKPENYETWRDMEILFDPRDMFRG